MYSGTTFVALKWFDAWLGAHQKIDRIARRQLGRSIHGPFYFPRNHDIVKFEGLDGPDGIKRKNPARDEPWHFMDPTDGTDHQILDSIESHYEALVVALRKQDRARAAFEAAWLAHGLVDGLTPAHHYPYEEELIKLRGGKSIDTRTSYREKLLMPGESFRKRFHNNWKMWGDKGLISTHFAFEWGVAAIITPLRLRNSQPSATELEQVRVEGVPTFFMIRANEIASLSMYETFYKNGWTPSLAKEVRKVLAPLIINTVTLAWYAAICEAAEPAKKKRKTA